MKQTLLLTTVSLALALLAVPAFAQTNTYDFSTVTGSYTSATTSIGIATFSSPSDSANQLPNTAGTSGPTGEFQFGANGGLFSTIASPYVLSSEGYVGAAVSSIPPTPYAPAILNISFSQAQSAINFDFATSDFFGGDGGDYLTLTTNTGATGTYTASVPGGDFYPEGSVAFSSGAPFTSVTIRTYDNLGDQDLVLGDLTSVNAAPEPVSCVLGLIALGSLLVLRRHALRA